METLWKDIVFSFRLMRRRPGLTLVILLSLGLGIGVNLTIFTFVNAILLQPLPRVAEQNQLVEVYTSYASGLKFGAVSYLDYKDLRDRNQVFSGLMAQRLTLLNLNSQGENEIVPAAVVSGNYFSVLGVEPARGRFFLPEEDQTPNANAVAVVSHGLWQRRFAGDPDLVGKTITINARNFTVVGIAPERFAGANIGLAPDVWVPLMMQSVAIPGDRLKERGIRWLELVGRLKPGVTVKQAQGSIAGIAAQLLQENPVSNRGTGATVVSLGQGSAGVQSTLTPILTLLMIIVLLVLLLACFNVANLLLARANSRRKEVGIRLAMGASRRRLVRQLLTESILLAILGGAVAFPLAYYASTLLLAFRPATSFPVVINPKIDVLTIVFAVGLSLVTGVIFGLVPATQTASPAVLPALKDDSMLQGYRKSRLRNLFVVAQVAISFVLLIGAGLFIRSLLKARNSSLGFESHNLLIASVDAGLGGYDKQRGTVFYQQLTQRVENLPGVKSVSLAKAVPLDVSGTQQIGVTFPGDETPNQTPRNIDYNVVTPKYFETMSIPLLQGRDFDERDGAEKAAVVIVNEAFVKRFWQGQSPIGKQINITGGKGPLEVIGLAKNSKYYGWREDALPFIYLPFAQSYRPAMTLHVNSVGDPAALINTVRDLVRELDRGVPIFNVRTMTEHLGVALFEIRAAAVMLTFFSSLALALAMVGLYGMMAHAVSQRKREIGIRMALGAQRGDILKLVLGEGLILTLVGLVIGIGLAAGLTRFISVLLYNVSPLDFATYGLVALILTVVALLASFLPAREAIKVEPIKALRYE
jgi:putative ABC transport system permease protein